MSLISYGNALNQGTSPVMVFEINDKKTSVTITGPKGQLEGWKTYFSNPDNGWGHHLEQDDPLRSMAVSSAYLLAKAPANPEELTAAKKAILKAGGKEVTVSW